MCDNEPIPDPPGADVFFYPADQLPPLPDQLDDDQGGQQLRAALARVDELRAALAREQDMHQSDREALHALYEREAANSRRRLAQLSTLLSALDSFLATYSFDELTQTVSMNEEANGVALRQLREVGRAAKGHIC